MRGRRQDRSGYFFMLKSFQRCRLKRNTTLGAQIRRASVSVTANISEGYGRFHYQRRYTILQDCAGIALRTKRPFDLLAMDLQYIDDSLFEKGIDLIEQAKVKLNGFIKFVEAKQKTE